MRLESLEALRRLRRTADKAVRLAAVWAPLLAAALGGASPARAAARASLNIDVTFSAITNITDLNAAAGASTGTISLSWTEPFHNAGVAPYAYDVRASTVGQIADDTVFSTSPALSVFSPDLPPAPGAGGGAAGFVATGLTPGVTYFFAIREHDSTTIRDSWVRSVSPPLNVDNFAVPASTKPAGPVGGGATAVSSDSITGTWGVSAGATDYVLLASTNAATPPFPIAASSTTASSTGTLSGLGPNTTYFLFVAACNFGCSPFMALGSTVTLASPAASLATTSVSSGTVALTWGASGNPLGSIYIVLKSTDGVLFSSATATVSTATVIGGLSGATTYYFEVVTVNLGGVLSAASNVVQVVTSPGPPAAPASGEVLGVTVSSVTAAWTASAGATDYLLVASTSAASPPVLIAASSTTLSSTATVSGLSPNTTYFAFAAACAGGCSPFTALGSTITLAAPAVALSTTALSSSTVSLAWSPNGDPTGTAFAVLISTDGVDFSTAQTVDSPAALVAGLTGGTTHDFLIVAINGAGIAAAPSNLLAVVTPSGPTPSTPTGLTATGGLLAVAVSWTPLPAAQQGLGLQAYLLSRSSNSGFGFVQIASTTGTSYEDAPLTAGVTEYYAITARAIDGARSAPSAAVSATPYTEVPMEPIGVSVVAASATVTINWAPTARFFDGKAFVATGTPTADELEGYAVFRSTNVCGPTFTRLSTMSLTTTGLTDNTGGQNYYYQLFSFNDLGYSSNTVTLSSLGEYNYFVDDCVTRLVLENGDATALNAANNGLGNVRVVSARRPQDVGNGVYSSVQWSAYLNGASQLSNFVLPRAAHYVLHFNEVNGAPAPDTGSASGFTPAAARAAAGSAGVGDLGVYWNNGAQFQKMYGKVDAADQVVTVDSPNLGVYQIRAQARAAGAVFDVSNMSSRVITPNGDGLNDTLIFTYDPGPNNVVPVGKIFDLRGAAVADMTPGLVPNTLTWNGFMNGLPVRSGVYVYRITGDGKTLTGTIVVAR